MPDVIRTGHERHRIGFHPGRLRPLVGSRSVRLLRGARAPRGGRGRRWRCELSRGDERREESQAVAAGRVVRIMSASGARPLALSGSGASSACGWRASCPHSLDLRGLFDYHPSSRSSSCSSSSPVSAVRRRCAALAGASKRRGTLGLCDLVGAHSRDRITTRWSRRRSAVGLLSGNRPPRLSANVGLTANIKLNLTMVES